MESQEEEELVQAAAEEVAETDALWTDERHVQFLNSIESSFVTSMFENSSSSIYRLRRHLPDASDSTTDLNPHRTTSVNDRVSGMGERRRLIMKGRRGMRRRSYSSQEAFNSFQDQVVPQIRKGRHDIMDDPEQASTVE